MNSKRGLTLVEFLIVLSVIAFLVFLILPGLEAAKRRPSINCINNLRQIQLAFKVWSADNNDKFPMQVPMVNGGTMESANRGVAFVNFLLMSNEISAPKLLICPQDKERKAALSFGELRNENISYFVGIDAEKTCTNAILVGDRNLTIDDETVKTGLALVGPNSLAGWAEEPHQNKGNLGMADWSVHRTTASDLQGMLRKTGFVTNRFAVP